jgi:hypothetical protein
MMLRRIPGSALVLAVGAVAAVALAAEPATTEVQGSATARRAGAVQVSFERHLEAAPRAGDRVEFSTGIDGIRVDAGQGEVAEVGASSAWVRVSRGRPGLGHHAVIRATGRGEPPQPRAHPVPPPTSP